MIIRSLIYNQRLYILTLVDSNSDNGIDNPDNPPREFILTLFVSQNGLIC